MENEIPQWMKEHIEADHAFQMKMEELIPVLVTKEDIKGLATEKSVREVVHWQRNIAATGELLSLGGKFSYRAIIIIATLLGALAVITGAWKGFVVWLVSRF